MTSQQTHCGRCGEDCRYDSRFSDFVLPSEMSEIRSPYQIWGVALVCHDCASVASKFCNYWGVKKKADLIRLRNYLQSGAVSSMITLKAYSSLMNGGYYD